VYPYAWEDAGGPKEFFRTYTFRLPPPGPPPQP